MLALVPSLHAQSVQPLVSEGDTVIGMGAIDTFNPQFVGLTDGRMWTMSLDTDFPSVQQDQVILRNGFVTLREGANMIQPAGSTLNQFLSISLSNDGDLGMILSTRNPTTTGNVYWNLIRIADFDTPIASPAVGPNTRWLKFEHVKLNAANQVFVIGEINNTSVATPREDALVRYDLDALGNVMATTVLMTKGMFNPTLGTNLDTLAISPTEHVLAVNEHGDFVTYVVGIGVRGIVMLNLETVLAQELTPSSVGVNWRDTGLGLTKVSLNDFGEWVLTGALNSPTNSYLIEKNGARFVRSGDVLPEYSASPIAQGRAAPIFIANTGDVFWRAETNAGEAAYMRNYVPIVKSGSTLIDGNLVLDLPPNEHAFAVSPDGRFFLGRIQSLQTVGESSVFVDFGLVVKSPGCAENAGRLFKTQGEARIGETLQLAMDAGQEPGVLPTLSFATRPPVPGSDCGLVTVAGELLISPAHRIANLSLPVWNGSLPTAINVPIPDDLALVDLKLWAQGFFRDANGSSGEPIRMTNALRIEIGAP